MAEHSLLGTSPLVAVRDLKTSLEFYQEVLGFDVAFVNEEMRFAQVRHGHALLSLREADVPEALAATGEHCAAVIWVEDADALWSAHAKALAALPEGQVRPPFSPPYRVREFHVKDPDGFLMFFTSARAE